MKRHLATTADGSTTLYVPELDEHYHSIHGAVQESLHVFIEHGLKTRLHQDVIHIFEMGLGTGLNLYLTALTAPDKMIHYTSVEAYPVSTDEATKLNYPFTEAYRNPELFLKIHQLPWEEAVNLSDHLTLTKLHGKLATTNLSHIPSIDIIYYDAFAPDAQPNLWTTEVFEQMFQLLKPGGILVTYCAKGYVKRNMKAAGYTVERLPGPPGKREMTCATKPTDI